jgi:hypothetical protein
MNFDSLPEAAMRVLFRFQEVEGVTNKENWKARHMIGLSSHLGPTLPGAAVPA